MAESLKNANDKDDSSWTPRVRVNLPVPDPDVISLTENDTVRTRYLEAIEKIAKLESETLIKIQEMNNTYKTKIALLIAGIIAIGGGALFKMKLEGRYGDTGLSLEPQSQTERFNGGEPSFVETYELQK